jgi:hypothetical protein
VLPERAFLHVVYEPDGGKVHVQPSFPFHHWLRRDATGVRGPIDGPFCRRRGFSPGRRAILSTSEYVRDKRVVIQPPDAVRARRF